MLILKSVVHTGKSKRANARTLVSDKNSTYVGAPSCASVTQKLSTGIHESKKNIPIAVRTARM